MSSVALTLSGNVATRYPLNPMLDLSNPMVSGALTLAAGGSVAAALYKVPKQVFDLIKGKLVYSVEIDDRDPSFPWVQSWLSHHVNHAQWVRAGVMPSADGDNLDRFGSGKPKPKFFLSPIGTTSFKYRGRRFLTWNVINDSGMKRTETIHIRSWRNARGPMMQMLGDAYDYVCERDGQRVEVWVPGGSRWRLLERKATRAASTLCLSADAAAILTDARKFLASREWYRQMGIPFRRGYFLHGPPGNGKSSLAHVLASELGVGVNILNLQSVGDDELIELLSRVPNGNLLLIEDIDVVFNKRKAESFGPSFAALLNALDGVAAQDGRIMIMTTNHADKLDPALIRPGRADVHVRIGNATHRQAAEMFERFFPGRVDAAQFANHIVCADSSMARVQEILLSHREDAEAAIAEAESDSLKIKKAVA